ncbi:thioesterase family protein [Nocardioides sp. 616]|uniref:acyl-CoA thioesterase n=1 Tax=Nocardioides sp. 616 TaxID=2268090 RepID=UPI001F06F88A|nr:thioesterase family protein [Nocardioides sp. 616]
MRHLYECPMRWADLDLLGHVNNVVFVDYLQEARVDMLRTHVPDGRAERLVGRPGEGIVVVRHLVEYLNPLSFRFRPVKIECWVTELKAASFTMAYEIFDEDDDGVRTTYARASTVLTPYTFTTERPRRLTDAERQALGRFLEPAAPAAELWSEPRDVAGGLYQLHVRFSDVDVYGHVNNVKYFEYFQEARVQLLDSLGREMPQEGGVGVVVARTEVGYRRPIHVRAQPYQVRTWVSQVGNRSAVVDAEITDEGTLLSRARVVLVFFDPATQRSVDPPPEVRARMLAMLEE